MKVMSIVVARPQFIKLAPVAHAMGRQSDDFEHVIVHTGQHYDETLSGAFFSELEIASPHESLSVGSGSHGVQTGRMLQRLDPVIEAHRPDLVLVYGDTNSTLAGALSAVKCHVPVAHLEAGLRSRNRMMPEEINRIAVDHVSDFLLAPTEDAVANLRAEGRSSSFVGDVMADLCQDFLRRDAAGKLSSAEGDMPKGRFYVCTLHRAENTDAPQRLQTIIEALAVLDDPVVLLAHPRLLAKAQEHGLRLDTGAVRPQAPVGYTRMMALMLRSAGVITDSGGLQKEAFFLGIPCTTVRPETEWEETLVDGWNVLAPDPLAIAAMVVRDRPASVRDLSPFGNGQAAQRVCEELVHFGDVG